MLAAIALAILVAVAAAGGRGFRDRDDKLRAAGLRPAQVW